MIKYYLAYPYRNILINQIHYFMKKVFTLSLIILFVLTSCSKDDSTTDPNSSNFFVGKWEYVAYVDENDYAWPESDGYYIFTMDRLEITGSDLLAGKHTYEYLADSKELIYFGIVHDVNIVNDDEIVIKNGCCGPKLKRID